MLFLGYSVGLEAEERRDTRLFPDRTRRKLSGHFDLYSSVIHVIILHFHSDFFLNLLLNTDHCYFARGEIPSRERESKFSDTSFHVSIWKIVLLRYFIYRTQRRSILKILFFFF